MREHQLRSAAPSDEPELLDLFATVFGVSRASSEWRWKFVASRALALDYTPVDSLLALDDDGNIVAYAGALTLPGVFQGEPTPFVQICDVMVHPAQRGGLGRNNLFTRMLRSLLSHIANDLPTAFRYGFPGRRPYLIGARSGVYDLIEIAVQTTISDRAGPISLWRAGPLSWTDARLDALWGRLGNDYALALVRDAAYLRWRYADHPVRNYQLLGLTRLGQLRGWAVMHIHDGQPRIVDLLVPKAALVNALAALGTFIQRLDVKDSATLLLPRAWCDALRSPSIETPLFTANMCWNSALSTQKARQHLYYTMGDVDIY